MTGILERTLAILELLAQQAQSLELGVIASALNIPRSATHRLLTDLCAAGYVRQVREGGEYILTIKLVSLGLGFLGNSGIVDVAQPLLDDLAEKSGELVRLSVVDGDNLTWVAKAQGAKNGLRYDPEMGMNAQLSCTASGLAWLITLSDETALQLVAKQGMGKPKDFGPNAPKTLKEFLKHLHDSRARGFSLNHEFFTAGMSAIAAPVQRPGHAAIGVINIAGPAVRFTEKRMLALSKTLQNVAQDLAAASLASPALSHSELNKKSRHVVMDT
jgi:DNA-binding IclR family transcriptional regulator